MAEDIEELEDDLDRGDLVEDDEDLEDDEEDISGESDDDDEDDEDELDDTEDEPSNIQVPKSRLDEVISQRESEKDRVRWLEEQLETLINQNKAEHVVDKVVKEKYDFTAAEENYASLLIDGETSKAAQLRSVIDGERKADIVSLIKDTQNETVEEATLKSTDALEQDRFDTLIGRLEEKHPFLDTESDTYDSEAVETVNTLISGYMSSGKTKSQALKIAVSKVIPMYTKNEPTTKQSLGNKRIVKARKKAARASNAQPSEPRRKSKESLDDATSEVSAMSERQYNKLTLKEKRVLRGD